MTTTATTTGITPPRPAQWDTHDKSKSTSREDRSAQHRRQERWYREQRQHRQQRYVTLSPKLPPHVAFLPAPRNPWLLQHWNDLEPWQQQNIHIQTGYLRASRSFKLCLQSILHWHNESINIWTHLVAGCIFLSISAQNTFRLRTSLDAHPETHAGIIALNTLFAALCYICSTAYHAHMHHSQHICNLYSRVDYLGIIGVMWSSTIAASHFGFMGSPRLQIFWMTFSSIPTFLAACAALRPEFLAIDGRKSRLALYASLGLSAFLPLLHGLWIHGWKAQCERQSLVYFVAMALTNFAGGAVYAARIPERWWPGRFDMLGNGHQILHLAVVASGVIWLVGLWRAEAYWMGRVIRV